jgi:hypothetical protein
LAESNAVASLNVGFLTVLHEPTGYLGGYLVTNTWGRPLEFRLSTAVQPNRVQQILYGGTLEPYVCADLIGKTLVEKTGIVVQLVVTDCASALELRQRIDAPVVWIAAPGLISETGAPIREATANRGALFSHSRYPQDVPLVRDLLDRFDGTLDLAEPFQRMREAIGEARKMGVTKSA